MSGTLWTAGVRRKVGDRQIGCPDRWHSTALRARGEVAADEAVAGVDEALAVDATETTRETPA